MLVNSQLVASCQLGVSALLCCICTYFFKRRPEEQQGSTVGMSFKEVFVKGEGGSPVICREEKVRKKRISLCLFEKTYQCLEGLERFLVRYAFYQAVGNKRHMIFCRKTAGARFRVISVSKGCLLRL